MKNLRMERVLSGRAPLFCATFYVQAIRIVDRKMIPLDLRGRPLLKPVKPQRMEDDPEYDGMIVRGVHSCFGAINALDLNSLAEKNRKAQNQ